MAGTMFLLTGRKASTGNRRSHALNSTMKRRLTLTFKKLES